MEINIKMLLVWFDFVVGLGAGLVLAAALWLVIKTRLAHAPGGRAFGAPSDPNVVARLVFAGQDLGRCDLDPLSDFAKSLREVTSSSDALQIFGAAYPNLASALSQLLRNGIPFTQTLRDPSGHLLEASGRTEGAQVDLTVRRANAVTLATEDLERTLSASQDRMAWLQALLAHSPTQCAIVDRDGTILLANAVLDREVWTHPDGHARLSDPLCEVLTNSAATGISRVQLDVGEDQAVPFELIASPVPSDLPAGTDQTFGVPSHLIALSDISRETDAEAAMAALTDTLTQTFAHLSIGLAVFDADRHLTLFNPALADITGLDAAALAQRPKLRDFFEALRRTRMLPEQSDFRTWRGKILAVEDEATGGGYQEDWVLPSGQVFQVTGRTHGQGGLAFLFDDISSQIRKERRYRAELGLTKATMDHLTDGIAVYSASGGVIFSNSVFLEMWAGTDPSGDIFAFTKAAGDLCAPNPAFGDLRHFVTDPMNRASWQAEFAHRDLGPLRGHFAPLPDGSTLAVFTALNRARVPQTPPLAPAGTLPLKRQA
ncbi:MAG: PAS domain-containing protein [Pseudomonadota bacterium]